MDYFCVSDFALSLDFISFIGLVYVRLSITFFNVLVVKLYFLYYIWKLIGYSNYL